MCAHGRYSTRNPSRAQACEAQRVSPIWGRVHHPGGWSICCVAYCARFVPNRAQTGLEAASRMVFPESEGRPERPATQRSQAGRVPSCTSLPAVGLGKEACITRCMKQTICKMCDRGVFHSTPTPTLPRPKGGGSARFECAELEDSRKGGGSARFDGRKVESLATGRVC